MPELATTVESDYGRWPAAWLGALGRHTLQWLAHVGRMGIFLSVILSSSVTPPLKFRRIVERIYFIGFQSLGVILLTGAFTGMVLSLQGYYALSTFGSDAFLGPLVALSLLRELGPVIAALMVTGRAGSAITAQIGVMRISEQIDALELMGLSPYRYLMVPNFLAALIAMPLLTAIFNTIGILGGYAVAVPLLGVNAGTYFGEMVTYVQLRDLSGGMWKALSFGAIISWVCTYNGYHSGYGAEGVSRATTGAVVRASVLILIWDYVMTSLLF